jgi:hypothetical protein
MTRLLTLVLAILCAAGIVMAQAPAGDQRPGDQPAAQAPPPSSPQPASPAQQAPSPSSSKTASTADKVTYTGCLKPGTTAGTWVLENAQAASASGAAASSTDRAVGTAGASKETFNLTVKPSDNLTPHANHKIEVTGTTSPAIATSMSPGAAAPSTAAPKQNFTVDSFKMVSASCQ